MHGLQRTKVCVLSVAVLSISSCVTSDKRLSEDLQTDGFIACLCDDEEVPTGPTVSITDPESAEMFAQWFRGRPRASGQWETDLMQQVFAGVLPFPKVKIETTRLRATLPVIVDLPVVLETRVSTSDDWSKNSWRARDEDIKLVRWVSERITAEYKTEAFRDKIVEWQNRESQ
jgi:hypothetical protein